MNKGMMIALLVISVLATLAAIFVCVQEFTVTNVLVAVVVLLCSVYFGCQIVKRQ